MSALNRPMFRKPTFKAEGTGITAYFGDGGYNDLTKFNPENVKATYSSLQELYAPLLGKERSMQDLIAERAKILGPLDNETAFNTGLARAGAAISKAGSLSAGLAPAAQAFTETSAEGEEKNKLLQRQVAMSALDQLTRERETAKQGKLSILGNAVQQEEARVAAVLAEKKRLSEIEAQQNWESIRDQNKNIFDKQQQENQQSFTLYRDALEHVRKKELTAEERAIKELELKNNFARDLAKKDPTTFMMPNNIGKPSEGFKILGEFKQVLTPEGSVEWRNMYDSSALPAGALKFDAQVSALYTPKFDAPKKAFLPDTSYFTGLRPIQYQTDSKGTPFMLDVNTGEKQPMPADAIIADQTEMFKVDTLPNGSSRYTITNGPFAGKTVITDRKGTIQNLNDIADVYTGNQSTQQQGAAQPVQQGGVQPVQQDGVQPVQQGVAQQGIQLPSLVQNNPTRKFLKTPLDPLVLKGIEAKGDKLKSRYPAIGEITGEGPELHILKAESQSSVPSYDLDDVTKREITRNIVAHEEFLSALDDVIDTGAAGAVGIKGKLKSIITNGLDPLVPGVDWAAVANEKNKAQLQMLTNKMISALAVNDTRISVDEQNRIRSIAPTVDDWFQSPAAVTAKLAEIIRHSKNNLSLARSRLDDTPALLLKQVPQGTINDPFTVENLSYLQALQDQGLGDGLVGKFFQDRTGKIIPFKKK